MLVGLEGLTLLATAAYQIELCSIYFIETISKKNVRMMHHLEQVAPNI
jgi:hypothetical protein